MGILVAVRIDLSKMQAGLGLSWVGEKPRIFRAKKRGFFGVGLRLVRPPSPF